MLHCFPMGIIGIYMLVLVMSLHLQPVAYLPAHLCTFHLPSLCRREYVSDLDVNGDCGHMWRLLAHTAVC